MLQSAAVLPSPIPAVAGAAEAAAEMIAIGKLMTELCDIIEAETDLVRAGRVAAAARAVERKGEVARAFAHNVTRMHAGRSGDIARVAPRLLDGLRKQHEQLCAKLQLNLTVLATA